MTSRPQYDQLIWTPDARGKSRETYRDKIVYTSFRELGGRPVSLDEVRAELSRLPQDLVLGIVARLSAWFIHPEVEVSDPRFQGQWLQDALVDDFPTQLRDVGTMINPGHVPHTGGRHFFIHEHNLAALAQLALLNCSDTQTTARFNRRHYMRVARLLLILNDLLEPRTRELDLSSLQDIRRVGVWLLYHGQFDQVDRDGRKPLIQLARWQLLVEKYLPTHYSSGAVQFCADTGIPLDVYWETAAYMIRQFTAATINIDDEQSPWGLLSLMAFPPKPGAELDALLERLTQTPQEFRESFPQTDRGDEVHDFQFLQVKPIIEGRPEEIIVPVASLLIRQLVNYPLFVLSSKSGFRRALGLAFEDYAHDLVCRIASGDPRAWDASKSRDLGSGEIDSMLWESDCVVLMEHKACHLTLTVGSLRAALGALGPHDDEFSTLGEEKRPKDGGAVTEPLWQFGASKVAAEEYLERRYGRVPSEVYPLVVSLEPFRVEEWLRKGYLDRLADVATGIAQPNAVWRALEWMHIGELEALAQLADEGRLDLMDLLKRKCAVPEQRMDAFLAERHHGVPVDLQLASRMDAILRGAEARYFPNRA